MTLQRGQPSYWRSQFLHLHQATREPSCIHSSMTVQLGAGVLSSHPFGFFLWRARGELWCYMSAKVGAPRRPQRCWSTPM